MQQQDQSKRAEITETQTEEQEQEPGERALENKELAALAIPGNMESAVEHREKTGEGLDWLALGLVLVVAVFFALMARLNGQPAPSFVPAAVLSATGCGLLVTALRKLRTIKGVGLFEAALGGFSLAIFQFAVALTYPNVFSTLGTSPANGRAFLLAWSLVALFTIVLSLAGAALGHLAFAPLRPLSERAHEPANTKELEEEEEEAEENTRTQGRPTTDTPALDRDREDDATDEFKEIAEIAEEETEESVVEESLQVATAPQTRPSPVNYAIAIVLFGLMPMLAGYVFAAAYDFVMGLIHADQIAPGLYPTLSLLSGLLPWRLSAPISLNSVNGSFIIFTLLWRIPDSFLGNPNTFDVQTLEPLLLNAAGLAILLLTMYRRGRGESEPQAAPWGIFMFLEVLLGFFLILPANLWMLQGLEGVLQLQGVAVPLPVVHSLNATMFILNLVTGPLYCLLVGLVVRRQYRLWTLPCKDKTVSSEA